MCAFFPVIVFVNFAMKIMSSVVCRAQLLKLNHIILQLVYFTCHLPIIWKILIFAAFGLESNPENISIEGTTYTLRAGVYKFSNHLGSTSKF